MTSESRSVTIFARVVVASPPPLINDKCFLTTFISLIVAPLRSSKRVVRCLSASVTPALEPVSRLDAPPDKSTISRSRGCQMLCQTQKLLSRLKSRTIRNWMGGFEHGDPFESRGCGLS